MFSIVNIHRTYDNVVLGTKISNCKWHLFYNSKFSVVSEFEYMCIDSVICLLYILALFYFHFPSKLLNDD